MNKLSQLLNDVIPTKWSQAIAALTLLAIPAAYSAPSLLPSIWLPNSSEQLFLIRLLLSGLIALVGSLSILILVIRAYNDQAKLHAVEISTLRKELTNTSPEDKKRREDFFRPIKYDNRGIV